MLVWNMLYTNPKDEHGAPRLRCPNCECQSNSKQISLTDWMFFYSGWNMSLPYFIDQNCTILCYLHADIYLFFNALFYIYLNEAEINLFRGFCYHFICRLWIFLMFKNSSAYNCGLNILLILNRPTLPQFTQ